MHGLHRRREVFAPRAKLVLPLRWSVARSLPGVSSAALSTGNSLQLYLAAAWRRCIAFHDVGLLRKIAAVEHVDWRARQLTVRFERLTMIEFTRCSVNFSCPIKTIVLQQEIILDFISHANFQLLLSIECLDAPLDQKVANTCCLIFFFSLFCRSIREPHQQPLPAKNGGDETDTEFQAWPWTHRK